MMLFGHDGFVVPGLEVVEGDGVDGGVLGLAGVGIVGAVDELDGLADGDSVGVVVAPGDRRSPAWPFASWSLSALKVGWSKRSMVAAKTESKSPLRLDHVDGGRGSAAGGLDRCGFGFELIVELVAVDGGGAAGSPGFAVDRDEADFCVGFIAAAAPDEDGAVDEGEFVVFLEEDDEAIGEFDSLAAARA